MCFCCFLFPFSLFLIGCRAGKGQKASSWFNCCSDFIMWPVSGFAWRQLAVSSSLSSYIRKKKSTELFPDWMAAALGGGRVFCNKVTVLPLREQGHNPPRRFQGGGDVILGQSCRPRQSCSCCCGWCCGVTGWAWPWVGDARQGSHTAPACPCTPGWWLGGRMPGHCCRGRPLPWDPRRTAATRKRQKKKSRRFFRFVNQSQSRSKVDRRLSLCFSLCFFKYN